MQNLFEEQGADLRPMDILNKSGAYADNGVLYVCAHLLHIRINVFRGKDILHPVASYYTDEAVDENSWENCINLYFSGPEGNGHYDLLDYGRPS